MFCSEGFSQDPNFHIYLMFGQSNMEGQGPIEAQDRVSNPRVMLLQDQTCSNLNRNYGEWYTATPPLVRCWGRVGPGDRFARTMAENTPSNITIGIVNTSVGGCDIALFQKGAPIGRQIANGQGEADIPDQFNGGYEWMLDLAKKAQTVGVIKGILFHQGETNTNDQNWKYNVQGIVADLKSDLGLGDIPFLAGELLYFNNGGPNQSCCASHNSEINKLPDFIPNTFVISANGLEGQDEAHFSTAAYREFGIRYATKMLELVETNSNPIPTVSIISPSENSSICIDTDITLTATASISSGLMSKVDFYDGNVLLGTDNSPPYSYDWNNASLGVHTIQVIATSEKNVASISAASILTVNPLPTLAAYSNVNSGTWQEQANVELCERGEVMFGPHPYDIETGWSWTGPNNFSANTREVLLEDLTVADSGEYTVSFIDPNGCAASHDYMLRVDKLQVSVVFPLEGSTVFSDNEGATIDLQVQVNPISSVNTIKYYSDDELIGEVTDISFVYRWLNVSNGEYDISAIVISDLGCENSTEAIHFTVSSVTSVNETSPLKINVVPNPTNGRIQILGDGINKWELLNSYAEVVRSGNGNELDIETLTSGVYYLSIGINKFVIIKE